MLCRTVLLIDDEEDVRLAMAQALELADYHVTAFARAERVLERIGPDFPGIIVSDIRMPKMDGMALLQAVSEIDPELPVIFITGHGDVSLAVEAMQGGACDFLQKPFANAALIGAVGQALARRHLVLQGRKLENQTTLVGHSEDAVEAAILGQAPIMVTLREKIRKIAAADIDVLITGETGTGKGLAARSLHKNSKRCDKPFVAINLAALPVAHMESELFGHEAGAFPGALRARFGRFEHAQGGTVFLDDIGAASLGLQAKLLHIIEQRAVTRLGSNEPMALDVRFIACSHQNLQASIAKGDFRADLYYRLAVASIQMPQLQHHIEDVPRLFHHMLAQAAERHHRPMPKPSPEVLQFLTTHHWPGNIRELQNMAERFVLDLELLGLELLGLELNQPEAASHTQLSLAAQMEHCEKNALVSALVCSGGDLKSTYEALGISRKTLYEKMQRHGLDRRDFDIF